MLNCIHATRLMSQAQDGPLALAERLALRWHLLKCQGCRHFRQQLGDLRTVSRAFTQRDADRPQDK